MKKKFGTSKGFERHDFSFLSQVKMNSTNWPTLNVWVFIDQLVEHCGTNAEAEGSNPVEVTGYISLVKLQLSLRRLYLHLNLNDNTLRL